MIPDSVTRLPLLQAVLDRLKAGPTPKIAWEKILLVGNQHLLPSTCGLVQSLLDLGLPPTNIVLTGKLYSCRNLVVEWLRRRNITVVQPDTSPLQPGRLVDRHCEDLNMFWRCVQDKVSEGFFSRMILLDDGGYGLSLMPKSIKRKLGVVAIEQTTSGLKNFHSIPGVRRINVAASAAKLNLESPIIAKAVAEGITHHIFDSAGPIGIVGLGNIGRALAIHLTDLGREAFYFDWRAGELRNPNGTKRVANIRSLCEKCSIIVGCTGEDVFSGAEWLGLLNKEITLISASSQDVEFRTVLRLSLERAVTPGADIFVSEGTSRFRVLHSGFPINFSGESEIEGPGDIQLTRALLLGGILQAIFCANDSEAASIPATVEKLNAAFQRYIALRWLQINDTKAAQTNPFDSVEWITEHSGGTTFRCTELTATFQ